MTTPDPPPMRVDPDIIGNAEGDRRALAKDKQAARDLLDAQATPGGADQNPEQADAGKTRRTATGPTLAACSGVGLILGGLMNPGGLAIPLGATLLAFGLACRFVLTYKAARAAHLDTNGGGHQ